MKYLQRFDEAYKKMSISEHQENIEDILIEFIDNNDFKLKLLVSPISRMRSKNPDSTRTIYVQIEITEDIARNLLPEKDRDRYDRYTNVDTMRYNHNFMYFPGMRSKVISRIEDLKDKCLKRLDSFGYRLYKSIDSYNNSATRSFYVTYRKNKYKNI